MNVIFRFLSLPVVLAGPFLVWPLLAGCSTPPEPRQPDLGNRVPVNRTVPPSLDQAFLPVGGFPVPGQPGMGGAS